MLHLKILKEYNLHVGYPGRGIIIVPVEILNHWPKDFLLLMYGLLTPEDFDSHTFL